MGAPIHAEHSEYGGAAICETLEAVWPGDTGTCDKNGNKKKCDTGNKRPIRLDGGHFYVNAASLFAGPKASVDILKKFTPRHNGYRDSLELGRKSNQNRIACFYRNGGLCQIYSCIHCCEWVSYRSNENSDV